MTITISNTNPVQLQIQQSGSGIELLYAQTSLVDDDLLDIESDDPVTLTLVPETGISVTAMHSESGTWQTWPSLSQTFDPDMVERTLQITATAAGASATKKPKVKIRPKTIRPGLPILL